MINISFFRAGIQCSAMALMNACHIVITEFDVTSTCILENMPDMPILLNRI